MHQIDEFVEKNFPENKRVRPRVFTDEVWGRMFLTMLFGGLLRKEDPHRRFSNQGSQKQIMMMVDVCNCDILRKF